ncbi:MAG TPA: hypothetical protein QGI69_05945, partial [Candidatus Marinimicrobia bacterium]|nr:hypothetical protein [Candidatus Neomarinimicrobiota bacterium]
MKTTTITNSKLFQSIITMCIFIVFGVAQNTLSIEVGDGAIDVLYNSDADIGGFQFTVEGATVTGASGGDSGANGFMLSCNSTMCLGFSMTGEVIPAGSGTLVVVAADITGDVSLSGIVVSDATGTALDFTYDGGDVYGCMDMDACNYNADATEDDGSCALDDCSGECGGSAVEDECGECGGDGSSCATSTIDILYNTTTDIGGFQFNVDGATVTGASGGAAADAGFTISTGNNTVLAFSFTGATIPAGSGILVQVEVQGDASAACLTGVVLSDALGVAIENEITDCFTISQVEIILGCTDETACNYNADSTGDDGSCEYAQENYDCDGNCTVEVDCTGECGGSAVVDECGECGGDGIGGHACDCDGNVEDCAGECGGSAVVDECGECGGDGTSCIPVQLGFGTVADGNMEITYNSPADIAGFQFYVSGVNVISAGGGDAADAGFSSSTGNNTVLGFSFTGGTIPAGSGVLIELGYEATADQACLESPIISDPDGEGLDIEIGACADLDYACDDVDADGICDDVDDCVGAYDECGVCNGDGIADGACDCDGNVEDCAGECGGTAVVDECGVCGGSAESCFIELSIGSVADGNMEILINNTIPIQGFQFNITGADLSSASGGIAGEYGYDVSIGVNSMVLGFSFTGVQIPASQGVLTNLAYTSTMNEACLIDEILA